MGFLLSLQTLDRADDHKLDLQFASTLSTACGVSTISAVC